MNNQENAAPQLAPQLARRPQSSSGSLFLLLIILFMFFGGESEPFTGNNLRDTLQSLRDEYSNYTAWMEGRPSNFTLQPESQAAINLGQAFLHTPAIPPTTAYGFYNNITGNYNSKSIHFRNITSPPPEVGWGALANQLYDGKNLTLVHTRAEGWNWTQTMHMTLSIFSYKSLFLPENSTLFYRFRAFIELEPAETRSSMLESLLINLRMEGIHIPHDGSLVALVEPKHISPDIRQLPAMVPPGIENATIHVISGQMSERIEEFEKSILTGTVENGGDDGSLTSCSFVFHGRLDPIFASQEIVDEYEREVEKPSGVPLEKLPQLRLTGALMSEECGILLELEDVAGITSTRLKQRIITFSAVSTVVFYLLIQFSLQVSDQWRTASGLLRGSRGVMATWLIADSYAAISHLMAAVMTHEVRYALLIPGFLGCVLLAADLRLLTYLNGVQLMLNQATANATNANATTTTANPAVPTTITDTTTTNIPVPAPAQVGLTLPTTAGAPPQTDVQTTPTARPSTAVPSITPQGILRVSAAIVRWLFANDFRAWLSVIFSVCTFCMVFLDLPLYGAWFIFVSSTWAAQVTRNVYQRTRRVLRHDTIILSSIFRLFMPLYLFACPNNLLNIEPAPWIWILPSWIIIQIAALIGQDYFGPTWFMPDFWNAGPGYDYHPDLLKPDEENAESKLGECAICMEPISADQGDIGPERSTFLQLCWKQAAKKRRVYALAPCGHNFHTSCLEQWMDIKSICPQCRGPLPPM